MKINYNNKKFQPVQNTENGETSSHTIFKYKQSGNILTAKYEGGKILRGHLIGVVSRKGEIEMRYHHINSMGQLMTGKCFSVPEIMENGKIRLHESWEWTSHPQTRGHSVLEEI